MKTSLMKVSGPRSIACMLGLVMGVALAATGMSRTADAQDVVRVAVGVDPVYTPWWVAQEKGFFAKHNIKAELTQFSGGPDLADATMADEEDVGSSGTATWMPRLEHGSLVVLATMATSPNAFRMAALTSIKTLADLRGKKVGSVAGSSTDYLWYLVTRKLKIPETGVQVVGMPPPELVPSLDRGDINAFWCWEPWPTRAVQVSGKDKVHILANSGAIGYELNFVVVANKAFVAAKPKVVVRLLAALRDAIDYQNKNPKEAAEIGATSNKLTPALASSIIDLYHFSLGLSGQLATAAKTEEEWMRSKDRLKGAPIDWNKTIERSYLDKSMAMK